MNSLRIVLLVALTAAASSCMSIHRWKYERLMLHDDLRIDIGGFQFDDQRTIRVSGGHQFESLDAPALTEHLGQHLDMRNLVWVVVSKQAQMDGWNEDLQNAAVSRLRDLGFRRIVIQRASSQRGPYIMYDSEQ